MATHIIVDGYNLIGSRWGLENVSLEVLREKILKELAEYKKTKKCSIKVVFDGENAGWMTEGKDRLMGIDIYYSRDGEKADDLICRIVAESKKKYILVTSDNDLVSRCDKYGSVSVRSGEFIEKMREAVVYGSSIKDENDENEVHISKMARKKGNPKRRSKKERQRMQKIRKI